MEKFISLFITLVIALIGSLAVNFEYESFSNCPD